MVEAIHVLMTMVWREVALLIVTYPFLYPYK